MKTLFLLSLLTLALSSCGERSQSDLDVIDGFTMDSAKTKIVPNHVEFRNPQTGKLVCGSGLIVHPRIVLTGGHCVKKYALDLLAVNGAVPVAKYSDADLVGYAKDFYATSPESLADGSSINYSDLGVLVYAEGEDLIKRLGLRSMIGIAHAAPAVGDAVGLVGFGIDSWGDELTKRSLGTERYGTNVISTFENGNIAFEKDIRDKETQGGTIGDSGGIVINHVYEALGIISATYPERDNAGNVINDVPYMTYAVDLTSATAKQIMGRAILCQKRREICAPWFPESGLNSEYMIGFSLQSRSVERADRAALLQALRDLHASNKGVFSLSAREVAAVVPNSNAEREGIKLGQRALMIEDGVVPVHTSTLALYADIAARKASQANDSIATMKVTVNQPGIGYKDLYVTPRHLSVDEMETRIPASIRLGAPKESELKAQPLDPNKRVGFAYTVRALYPGSSYRSLEVTEVFKRSPAEAAGLKVGDSVVDINYRWIRTFDDMARAYEQTLEDKMRILVKRQQSYIALQIDFSRNRDFQLDAKK